MKTDTLRKKYLNFFEKKDHILFRSDTLVPDDETLLFTSAGMNQFKPYFLGEKKDIKRATSCQKCFRTGDLDEVGKTPFHHTFFEMLGNFSFGDYFKKEAIELAWEFMLKEVNLKEQDLWVSVYKDDDEAYNIWKDHIGVPAKRIVKLGEKENFWPANAPTLGPNGVCGPCSEIFFDRGVDKGCGKKDCEPGCDCDRFVEVWNLVFTQFNRVGKNKLEPLPQKNIDTGMGLERMAAVLQGKYSNFEIDILAPAVDEVRKILKNKDTTPRVVEIIHSIVDHARAAVFSISDGIYPSNEERGYVIRKVIRKALWGAHLLGQKSSFLYKLVPLYAKLMSDPYPELREKQDVITKVIKTEEEKFLSTLKDGQQQLKVIIEGLKKSKKDKIQADDLFKLYDTYGFPLELSKDIASASNMAVDEKGFNELLKKQQEQSRKKSMFDDSIFKAENLQLTEISEFVGYHCLETQSKIVHLIKDGKEAKKIEKGDKALVVLDKTPFYFESGGQLTDHGLIDTKDGQFVVEAVSKIGDTIVHKGKVTEGTISKGKASPIVDETRRRALRRAHTATHLLQSALRKVLGEHVVQQGSLVDEDRLRFDFAHFEGLTSKQIQDVESLVNEYILESIPVDKATVSFDEAKKQGALAFFKDKYKDDVRVVSVGEHSKELCGGTHVDNTAEIGLFAITSESSISSGVRRIEAVVGTKSYEAIAKLKKDKESFLEIAKADDMVEAAKRLLKNIKEKDDQISNLAKQLSEYKSADLGDSIKEINKVQVLIADEPGKSAQDLVLVCDKLKEQNKSLFIVLTSESSFVCAVTDDLSKKGITAKNFCDKNGKDLSFRGGGRDSLVRGSIQDKNKASLENIENSIKAYLKG